MRDSVMWFLVTSVVVTALSMVYVRHQHRIAYSQLQMEETRRDALNDEWGQLLIEENLWAFPHRIEKDASQRLAMRLPAPQEIEFVGLPHSISEVNDATR
ncbi:MAG: cell division protein FtsL [Gammaproteobacteria bacterium]|nr:cell division protein FtsL [Gammaproteobacteria bacterium]